MPRKKKHESRALKIHLRELYAIERLPEDEAEALVWQIRQHILQCQVNLESVIQECKRRLRESEDAVKDVDETARILGFEDADIFRDEEGMNALRKTVFDRPVSMLGLLVSGEAAEEFKTLVQQHMRLAYSFAKQFSKAASVSLPEVLSDAYIGLIIGLARNKPELGNKVSTYVVFWIRHHLRRSFDKTSHLIHIPVHLQELLRNEKKVRKEIFLAGEEQTEERIAERLGISLQMMQNLHAAKRAMRIVSLDASRFSPGAEDKLVSESERGSSMFWVSTAHVENIPGSEDDRPDVIFFQKEEEEMHKLVVAELEGHVVELQDREKVIFRRRFGLNGSFEMESLSDIGRSIGLSRERIRQICLKVRAALGRKMRETMSLLT